MSETQAWLWLYLTTTTAVFAGFAIYWAVLRSDGYGGSRDVQKFARLTLTAPFWPVWVVVLIVRVSWWLVTDAFGGDR